MARIPLKLLPIQFTDGDQVGTNAEGQVDVAALEKDLRQTVRGEVRFDAGSRAMYAHDASNYRMVPIGVVIPFDLEDAVAALGAAHRHRAPVIARGGGTAIPGQSNNVGLMIDFSKYCNRLEELNADERYAIVEPGIVLDTLRDAAEQHCLTFGPDPATHNRCTLGGMVGNNSCGIHSVMAGRTADNIEALEIVTYDGIRMWVGKTSEDEFQSITREDGRKAEIYRRLLELVQEYGDEIRARYPKIPRRVSGYNLDELLPENGFHVARALVGSECTCVLVLRIKAKLVESPQARTLLVLGFPDIATAGDFVPHVLPHHPIGCEGLDDTFVEDMRRKHLHPKHLDLLPEGRAWLMVEFGGKDKDEADSKAKSLLEDLRKLDNSPSEHLIDNPELEKHLWELREAGLGATARVPGEKENWEGWEDTAVPPDKVGAYTRELQDLMQRYDYRGAIYGHFGDGCVHVRLDFDLETAAGIKKYRDFVQRGAELVAKYGGSLSGEHGDGQARGELLTRMYGERLVEAFSKFKALWDPDWRMNPGKVIAPYRLDENLKLGTGYSPPHPRTYFSFPEDHYSFPYASLRCVGAGVCRRKDHGTMCPSYMVTHEEKHSTRGRARLLFEMLEGDPVKDGWRSEEVKSALDLCLACKGCKGDCPVKVDMATYKAEFLAHYYEGRFRPRHAYAFGLIHKWSRIASLLPGFVNWTTHAAGIAKITKWLMGADQRREIPEFAKETFKQWYFRRGPENLNGREVILWADTFNDHFHPQIAKAALEVLEAAGFQVKVPAGNVCCGRPLYDFGMVGNARQHLLDILTQLKDDIERGTPVVVVEPSCASVFRDEMLNLLPHNHDAQRLKEQVLLLDEFLEKEAVHFDLPVLPATAIVHNHCHHKSVLGTRSYQDVLTRLGLTFQVLDSGCCGMAGAFGFEAGEHYEVSMKCGERVLLPAVRNLPENVLLIADGFSCREQIRQATGRTPLHIAEVIQMALRQSASATGESRGYMA